MPDELLAVLPAVDEGGQLRANAPPPREPRWTDPAFSLFALVSALTRPGANLQQEVQPWSEEPGGWAWDARWGFLHHLALSVGVLVHRADGVLVPASGLPRLLDDPAALAERVWRGYLHDRSWSELTRAGLPDVGDDPNGELVDNARRCGRK